jgi:hypothetical protein
MVHSLHSSNIFCEKSLMESLISSYVKAGFKIFTEISHSLILSPTPQIPVFDHFCPLDISLFKRRFTKCPTAQAGCECSFSVVVSNLGLSQVTQWFLYCSSLMPPPHTQKCLLLTLLTLLLTKKPCLLLSDYKHAWSTEDGQKYLPSLEVFPFKQY